MNTSGTMLPLTQKDLAYLHDMMSWELLACKKAYQYAHQTKEPDCRDLMLQISEQHQRNLERALSHLQAHVGMQPATTGAQPTIQM